MTPATGGPLVHRHYVMDLGALTETLIIDDDGLDDSRELDDRLLLGLEGSSAKFELGLFRPRARPALEEKVRRGHILWKPGVGFVKADDHRGETMVARERGFAVRRFFVRPETTVSHACRSCYSGRLLLNS